MNESWDFPVLDEETDYNRRMGIHYRRLDFKRQAMIVQRRQERLDVEWANLVCEWAWFAGAGLFSLGVIFGVALARV